MCGIAGLAGGYIPGLVARMNEAQKHRGPDGDGIFEDPQSQIALGHVRLSVLDLSNAAKQPMGTRDGRFILIYNGEIYNYRELRKELESKGEQFSSSGDTEVLLSGLAMEGVGFLQKLNGIFAFAFWDSLKKELLLARDPLGVKPLYLAEPAPGNLAFASEIKALLVDPRVDRSPDFVALLQHLSFCHSSGTRTALKTIRRLEGGHFLRWTGESKSYRISSFWKPQFHRSPRSYADAVDSLRIAAKRAVARQLVSDVPVGAFLSGGLDSTLLASLVTPEIKSEFRCYTVTYPSEENRLDRAEEDGPFAQRVARRLAVPHLECEIKPNVVDLWPTLLYYLDEPIADPAAIACYLISNVARTHRTKVLLSGQGADELFGGYPRYQAMSATRIFGSMPSFIRRAVSSWGRSLPGAREGRIGAKLRRIRRVLSTIEMDPDRRFMSYCANTPDEAALRVLSPEFRNEIHGTLPTDECIRHMNEVGLDGVDRWLERDLKVYLPNHNLLYTDKMSMAVGVEARVPLLDMELVNLATSMPPEWKVNQGTTKMVLRDASKGIVSEEVLNRPKAGFGAPYRKWLRYDLSEMWNDLTSPSGVRLRGWFDPVELQRIRNVSQSGQEDLYMLQWAVLTVELWARQFMMSRNSA
jgi:asparagine synthase (glutamine-hydrolysing)